MAVDTAVGGKTSGEIPQQQFNLPALLPFERTNQASGPVQVAWEGIASMTGSGKSSIRDDFELKNGRDSGGALVELKSRGSPSSRQNYPRNVMGCEKRASNPFRVDLIFAD